MECAREWFHLIGRILLLGDASGSDFGRLRWHQRPQVGALRCWRVIKTASKKGEGNLNS